MKNFGFHFVLDQLLMLGSAHASMAQRSLNRSFTSDLHTLSLLFATKRNAANNRGISSDSAKMGCQYRGSASAQ